jgi:hypothetical protein
MNFPSIIAIAGLLLTAIWLAEVWGHNAARKRRERDRAREARDMRHITGSPRWWKEPPDDELHGDY